jgi:hypothetical protein
MSFCSSVGHFATCGGDSSESPFTYRCKAIHNWHNLGVNILIPILLATPLSTLVPAQSDAELIAARAAVDQLSEELAFDLAEQLRMECSWVEDFRAQLQSYVLGSQSRDAGTWPLAEQAPMYDAKKHCPAQPIVRKRLKVGDPRSVKAKALFRSRFEDQAPQPGWDYDYSSGELRRRADWNSAKRLLRNALLGAAPDQDLAQALLEMQMDDSSMRAVMVAFSHGYADRSGRVYPGITLYDAWSSGAEMEMPDVECLGIIHDLLDDWKTWRAPVRKQESLYDAIGDLFVKAQQHRGLRHALAITYFTGAKAPLAEYGSNHMQFHALWEECTSIPKSLVERLPGEKTWRSFLEDWRDHVKDDSGLQAKAQVRWKSLSRSEEKTRELALRILKENELIK